MKSVFENVFGKGGVFERVFGEASPESGQKQVPPESEELWNADVVTEKYTVTLVPEDTPRTEKEIEWIAEYRAQNGMVVLYNGIMDHYLFPRDIKEIKFRKVKENKSASNAEQESRDNNNAPL